jgi:predicted XRE-type DNA-binding protein
MTTPQIPADVAETAQLARDLMTDGEAKMAQAGRLKREVAKRLRADGWTHAKIAPVLGVNEARVSQLLAPPKTTSATG